MAATRTTAQGRPVKVRPDEVEGLVFAAVERLLTGGERFTDLQMQRIADEAGVARSTLYLHYADKTSLLLAVAEAATRELFAAAESWMALPGETSHDALCAAVRGVVAQRRRHHAILLAFDEATGYDVRAAEYWRGRIGGYVDVLAARLEDDQRRGVVAAGLDCHAAAMLLTWGIERAVAQHVATTDAAADTDMADGLASTVWTVIFGGGQPGAPGAARR